MTHAGKCADVSGSNPQDGAQIVQNPCTSAASQLPIFDLGSLQDQEVRTCTGKCWDIPGGDPRRGIIQYTRNLDWNQKFRFVPTEGGRYEIGLTRLLTGIFCGPACLTSPRSRVRGLGSGGRRPRRFPGSRIPGCSRRRR
ncbi:RICIN domain-containing protein [Streptomyces hygroscopicus]|uniref:RICIN domain-containing protein n=1 Tax=Streptomyces hygroscopicus TaxID=1912 RepID=UPI0033FB6B4F